MSATSHPLRIHAATSRTTVGAANADTVVAHSAAMKATLEMAERFASSDATVLLLGESGTGKEVVARRIHQTSDRVDRPFVRLNCAALPESLVESELFGHVRGAFTGADSDRLGHLEYAADGTLLLDEVGELPLAAQAKLLRVLEEGEFQRLGSVRPRPMEARIIAATNRDLIEEVRAGRFRPDLFYRLHVLNLCVPPLRQRMDDIQPLTEYFGRLFATDMPPAFSQRAQQQLLRHPWPGNVRELKNAVQRAVVLARSNRIEQIELLDPHLGAGPTVGSIGMREVSSAESATNWPDITLAEAERRTFDAALARSDGNQAAAARRLGVTPRTVTNMLKRRKAA